MNDINTGLRREICQLQQGVPLRFLFGLRRPIGPQLINPARDLLNGLTHFHALIGAAKQLKGHVLGLNKDILTAYVGL